VRRRVPETRYVPPFIAETVESVFGEKEMMPLSAFARKLGLDRKTILHLISENLLDVFQYSPGCYRKMLVTRTSFVRFLRTTSLKLL